MADILIRSMEAEEAKEVRALGSRSFSGLESLWISKPKDALVATLDGKIVGATLYKLMMVGDQKIGYVDYAFIDPVHQGKGVGSMLYKATTEHLWALGCDAQTAIVKDDNVGSWRLFQHNGFVRMSLPEMVRQFGVMGTCKQYFVTPLCFGVGMEYYAALRQGNRPSGKEGSFKQMMASLLANSLLFWAVISWRVDHVLTTFCAWIFLLLGVMAIEAVGTRCNKRKWQYRHTNGGALVCILVSLGSIFPMIGNWYPTQYENTREFRRDMGFTALVGWLFLLAVAVCTLIVNTQGIFIQALGQLATFLLIYRMLPFYPFESFGGKRVFNWNKWIYYMMSICTLAILALLIMR